MSYQFSNIKALGDNLYFPFIVTRTSGGGLSPVKDPALRQKMQSSQFNTQDASIQRNIFLTAYSEEFGSNWTELERAFGRLNPDFRYVNTIRKLTMSFTLPAKNVADSKANLDFCSGLARVVYGDYTTNFEKDTFGQITYNFQGTSFNTRIKFGNLLRNELCQFTDFSFTPEFDSGVFEYNDAQVGVAARPNQSSPPTVGRLQEEYFSNDRGPGALIEETGFVYHSQKGKVYPKQISVNISAIILHDYPLGFGGRRRPGAPLKWAENKNRDWPHGTGPTYPVLSYMTSQEIPLNSPAPPRPPVDNTARRTTREGGTGASYIARGSTTATAEAANLSVDGREFEVVVSPDGNVEIQWKD
tara:strand:- start:2101 stop:3174 length:1074 start_codon:yes stop_codon:yes gene_type:complete